MVIGRNVLVGVIEAVNETTRDDLNERLYQVSFTKIYKVGSEFSKDLFEYWEKVFSISKPFKICFPSVNIDFTSSFNW